ncbi:MAG: S1-C subfamily serine protease [Candidatus Poriferisodalaceae bacterium]
MTDGGFFEDPAEDPAEDPSEPDDGAWFAQWRDNLLSLDDEDDDHDVDSTAPFPLPPEDRLWRHPSELKFLDNPVPAAQSAATTTGVPWRPLALVAGGAGLAGALFASAAFALFLPRTERLTERVVEQQAVAQTTFAVQSGGSGIDVPAIAEATTPAIVRVEVIVDGQSIGSGSGVIFRNDGHLMTNAHVVQDATSVRIVLANGEIHEGEVVGADTITDIAVIRIIGADEPFPVAVLGATGQLRAGAPAIAIGSPLRLHGGPTVTMGVVSATHRRLQSPNGDWLYDLVQTDAPISPGSSGGALLDSTGAVIGITTAIAVSEVGAEGLGFATPIEVAHAVATDLILHGEARHGMLGVRGQDAVPSELHDGYEDGVAVRDIDPSGPAAAAGLEIDDIIVAIDGQPVTSMAELVVTARLLEPGTPAQLTVQRNDLTLDLTLIAGQLG